MNKLKGHLFQHMDSRGGSTLIADPSPHASFEKYIANMGWKDFEDDEEVSTRQVWDWAFNDYEGEATLLWEGEPLDEGELLADMGGEWKIAELTRQWASSHRHSNLESLVPGERFETWHRVMEGRYFLLYKGDSPEVGDVVLEEAETLKYRFVVEELEPRMDDDAYGLILQY